MEKHSAKKSVVTPQEIWKILKEVSISQKDTDRRMKETDNRMKETDRRLKETDLMLKNMSKETDRKIKENDRRIKKLDELFTGQWGKLIESLVEGDLKKLLQNKGIKIRDVTRNTKGMYKGKQWEVDIIATNGDEIVLVEVKTTLKVSHVQDFLKKLQVFSQWKKEYRGYKIYGSVAYLREDQSSTSYAQKEGLYVIRATGSSASIINKDSFKPKIF